MDGLEAEALGLSTTSLALKITHTTSAFCSSVSPASGSAGSSVKENTVFSLGLALSESLRRLILADRHAGDKWTTSMFSSGSLLVYTRQVVPVLAPGRQDVKSRTG